MVNDTSETALELSIIVPCFNEEATLPLLVARMEPVVRDVFMSKAELVAVDDGSTDKTWSVLQALSDRYSFLTIYRHEKNRGLSEAWQTGAKAARGNTICTLDADLQYRPEEIQSFAPGKTDCSTYCVPQSRSTLR